MGARRCRRGLINVTCRRSMRAYLTDDAWLTADAYPFVRFTVEISDRAHSSPDAWGNFFLKKREYWSNGRKTVVFHSRWIKIKHRLVSFFFCENYFLQKIINSLSALPWWWISQQVGGRNWVLINRYCPNWVKENWFSTWNGWLFQHFGYSRNFKVIQKNLITRVIFVILRSHSALFNKFHEM